MEEVWKDITALSSARRSHLPTTAAVVRDRSSVHEFLASPIYPPTESCDPKLPGWSDSQQLSNCIKVDMEKKTDRKRPSQQNHGSFHYSCSSPVLSSVMGSSLFNPQCSQKRDSEDDNACGDRRYKRKMKNRASATRSRARKQAYTNELELEVAHLREENAMLRRRLEEIRAAAAAEPVAHVPKKSVLIRSQTASF